MPEPYARHLERTHDFLGCFEAGVISGRVRVIKPEPQIFALAAERFGVQPASLLFLDDVAVNVRAAHTAGWRALQFVSAADCERQMRENAWL